MKKYLVSTLLFYISLSPLTYASDYSSTQTQSNGGYSSSQNNGYNSNEYSSSQSTQNSSTTTYTNTSAPTPPPEHHKKHHSKFSFSINIPNEKETIVFNHHGIHTTKGNVKWVSSHYPQPIPRHAVVGGGEAQGILYVCRANYNGLQPGKLYNGRCVIGYAGQQIPLFSYEVLTSRQALKWIPARYGAIPHGAIPGGFEHGRSLYICQADYQGGTHSGKVVGRNCNFGWGDKEVSIPEYRVLTY